MSVDWAQEEGDDMAHTGTTDLAPFQDQPTHSALLPSFPQPITHPPCSPSTAQLRADLLQRVSSALLCLHTREDFGLHVAGGGDGAVAMGLTLVE